MQYSLDPFVFLTSKKVVVRGSVSNLKVFFQYCENFDLISQNN